MNFFNDDDVYIYKVDTKVIINVIGCSNPAARSALHNPPAGCAAVRGMRAKHLNLSWS